MMLITCKTNLMGVKLPALPIDPTCKACPTFHIKGMCNTGCGNEADNVPYTREQDPPLWGCALQAMPEIKDPAPPIAYEIDGGAKCVLPVPITKSAPSVRMCANTTPSPNTQSVTTTKKRQPTRMTTSELDAKRPTRIPRPQQVKLPDDISKYVVCNTEEVTRLD